VCVCERAFILQSTGREKQEWDGDSGGRRRGGGDGCGLNTRARIYICNTHTHTRTYAVEVSHAVTQPEARTCQHIQTHIDTHIPVQREGTHAHTRYCHKHMHTLKGGRGRGGAGGVGGPGGDTVSRRAEGVRILFEVDGK